MSPAVVNGSSFAVVIVRSPLRSSWTGSQRADRAEHDLALADRVRLGGREREKRRVDAGGQIPTDVSADLVRRAADDQVVDDLLGHGRDRPLAVAALPRVPHRPERRGAPERRVERPVDGHVEVGGHVTPHRRLRRGPRRIDVDEEACRDLDRPGIAPGAGSGLAHDGDGLRHVVGGEPVQDRAVADLARDPQHPGPERRDVDGDRLDGRFGQAKAVHRERLAAEDDALARERPAEELRRLAHAGRGTSEGAAVPRLDDGLGARADAEAEPAGRDRCDPRRREGERRRAAAVAVRRAHAGRHGGAGGRREGPRRRGGAVHGGIRAGGPWPRRVRGIRIQERDPADGDRPHRAPAADGPDQAGRALPREARRGRLPRRLRVQGHPRQRRAAQDARRPRRPPAGQGHRLDPSPRRARALRRVAHARAVRLATVPTFHFDLGELPPETRVLREEVRDFLRAELGDRAPARRAHSWGGFDREFSRKVGDRGWIGMTWPERYGGHERSSLERYVVLEEMLAAGAPVSAHWGADRQSGPLLLRFGTEAQRARFLPAIARGELAFAIGMSEPDSGSDLASIRTRAERVPGGYRVNGTKVWTSNAHLSDYMIALFRTHHDPTKKHEGLTQFLLDTKLAGITINPIIDLAGSHHFNMVVFEDVFLPEEMRVGEEGAGWRQVTTELALERSGPERYLSSLAHFLGEEDVLEHDHVEV